jgi:hypothetical protein
MLTNPAYRQRGADSTILSEPELIRVLAEPPPLDLIDRQSSRFTEPTISDPLVKQRVDRSSCKLLNWRPRQDNFKPLECNEEPGLWRMWYVS